MNFDLTPEQDQLRDAVAALGRRYGHALLRREGEGRRTHHRAVGRGRPARLPRRQHPHRVRRRGRRHHRAGHRLRGAGRGRLPAAAAGGLPGHRGHRHRQARHRGAAQAATCPASPTAPRRSSSRSPSRRPAPTSTGSARWPAATATTGCSTAASATSPASTRPVTCWWSPGPRTRATGKLQAGAVPRADRRGRADPVQAGHGDRVAGEPVPALPRRRAGARRRAASASRWTPGCRRSSPGSTRSGSRSPRWAPAPAGTRIERASRVHRHPQGLGRPIGSHQGVAHPLAHAAVQVELARLMIAKAATLYDAGRDLEAGVAGNMAKYAAGGGRRARRRHRRPGARRRRHDHRVRRGDPARRGPGRPDRPGQPRDDPQLRGPARPRPGQVLLDPGLRVRCRARAA